MRYKQYTKAHGFYYITLHYLEQGCRVRYQQPIATIDIYRHIPKVKIYDIYEVKHSRYHTRFSVDENSPWYNFDIYRALLRKYDFRDNKAYIFKPLDKLSNEI